MMMTRHHKTKVQTRRLTVLAGLPLGEVICLDGEETSHRKLLKPLSLSPSQDSLTGGPLTDCPWENL